MNAINKIYEGFGVKNTSFSNFFTGRRILFNRYQNAGIIEASAADFITFRTVFLAAIGGKNWSKKRNKQFAIFCEQAAKQTNRTLFSTNCGIDEEVLLDENGKVCADFKRCDILRKRAASKAKFTIQPYSLIFCTK
jgi:hypothetical protein